jgi:hypothetical protein
MRKLLSVLALGLSALALSAPIHAEETAAAPADQPPAASTENREFTAEEVLAKAKGFFGDTTEGLAKAIEKLFAEQGKPNAVITGEEGGGAIVVGLRYGKGTLETASGETRTVYWQGPSVGFDIGGNAAKVFTLIYNLRDPEQIYQRFPGVDGSLYFIAGVSVNYQRSGAITLAPIRTGVGWRQGASIGYLHYTKNKHINPL